MASPCRLYVLPAADAPVALVLRRGPSAWWHLLRWDTRALRLEPGAWFKGTLYPRRSQVSDDGVLFAYFALRGGGTGAWGAYLAVSKLPWLPALAAWDTLGTWTGGCRFGRDRTLHVEAAAMSPEPFAGSYPGRVEVAPLSTDWEARTLQNERARGWRDLTGVAAEAAQEALALPTEPVELLRRERPRGGGALVVASLGSAISAEAPAIEHARLEYGLEDGRGLAPLADVVWADWDGRGRLLVATASGSLEVRTPVATGRWKAAWGHDLNGLSPEPRPAPDWATRW